MNENESEPMPSHLRDEMIRQSQVNNTNKSPPPPNLSDEMKINSLREMTKFAPNQQIKEKLEKQLDDLTKNNTKLNNE